MKKIFSISCLLLFAAFSLVACKEDDPEQTKVTLEPERVTVTVGETAQLTVHVSPASAAGAGVVWRSENESVATVADGLVSGVGIGSTRVTAEVDGAMAACEVEVVARAVSEVRLEPTDLLLTVGQTGTLTATVLPEDATDPSVTWSSDDTSVATVADGTVTAVGVGQTVIRAVAGACEATCTVMVEQVAEPKVGDYFYSDGTWSDGGLVSIGADGTDAVWAETKPAPQAGKTVIGIVFQTDPERLAASDVAAGYTHGYVMAVKTAHGADKLTTYWGNDWDFSCLDAFKLASSWYGNVNGYVETMTVRDTYGESLAQWMPAFDLVLNAFSQANPAPAGTSGWFLPSTGQLWDMVANLCGDEAARIMQEWQTMNYDATYYCSEQVSYDALARFNACMSEIPDADKEELIVVDTWRNYASVWASTPYDAEAACQMNIGTDGLIECMCDWYDGDAVARPILAF